MHYIVLYRKAYILGMRVVSMAIRDYTDKKGVEMSSIEKVFEIIQNEKSPITLSALSTKVRLHITSVRSCIRFLKKLNHVEIITNGKITLVVKKESKKEDGNQ